MVAVKKNDDGKVDGETKVKADRAEGANKQDDLPTKAAVIRQYLSMKENSELGPTELAKAVNSEWGKKGLPVVTAQEISLLKTKMNQSVHLGKKGRGRGKGGDYLSPLEAARLAMQLNDIVQKLGGKAKAAEILEVFG